MQLELPSVTLFSVYTVAHDLTRRALADCLCHARFGDVKVFSDREDDGIIKVEKFATRKRFSQFCNYDALRYISTTHLLSFQWDGWIINPEAWTDEFLHYDYIGAPWWYEDGYNVGNSGFCLRSLRLMEFLADHRSRFPFYDGCQEDDLLCRHYRHYLEAEGFRWAPDPLAFRFSQERVYRPVKSFGFHGVFNFKNVLPADQVAERITLATDYERGKTEWKELVA